MEKRVLVVDDDPPTRQMIAAVLSRAGFAVDLCDDGSQALEQLETTDYAVVVLALVQRDAQGDEQIFTRLHEKERQPSVVVISAGAQGALDAITSDLIRARLRKPFHIEDLVGAVRSCFGESSS